MIRDSLILFAITLIAGLLLGGVYAITKNPIAKTQEDKKNEAYQAVFTDAAEFTEVTDAADAQQILADAGYTKDRIDEVKAAMDADGNILGYVMTITSSEAYGGELQLATGTRMGFPSCHYRKQSDLEWRQRSRSSRNSLQGSK